MSEQNVNAEAVVDEFISKLMDLMGAVADDSDTYGTYYEENELRKFLLRSGLFGAAQSDGDDRG